MEGQRWHEPRSVGLVHWDWKGHSMAEMREGPREKEGPMGPTEDEEIGSQPCPIEREPFAVHE
jgi:hypothetical protein